MFVSSVHHAGFSDKAIAAESGNGFHALNSLV
jgi:hypothetical protein